MTIIVEGFPEGFSEKEMIAERDEYYATLRTIAWVSGAPHSSGLLVELPWI